MLLGEKQDNTIGRPAVSFRKVMDGIAYVLRTGCQWKILPKYAALVPHATGGSRIRWSGLFKKIWVGLLKTYDHKIGVNWTMT
jgi:transposase